MEMSNLHNFKFTLTQKKKFIIFKINEEEEENEEVMMKKFSGMINVTFLSLNC